MIDPKQIAENLINGQAPKVKELVEQALKDGLTPGQILKEGLIAGMNVVGTRFKANEFYIPEVLVAARAMHAGMEILRPHLVASGAKLIGTKWCGVTAKANHAPDVAIHVFNGLGKAFS